MHDHISLIKQYPTQKNSQKSQKFTKNPQKFHKTPKPRFNAWNAWRMKD